MEITLVIILVVFVCGLCVVVSLKNRNNSSIEHTLHNELTRNRKESGDSEQRLRVELGTQFKQFGDSIDKRMSDFSRMHNSNFEGFSLKLSELIEKNDIKMEKMREMVEKKLTSIQKDTSDKLEKMRETVDEKLHATLEKRFGDSFKVVSDRLEAVHKGLGEMQTIALGVGDLKKVLSNVKSRGTWGEAQLGNLLAEILTPEQYEKNVRTKKLSKENVEFAVKLPGSDDVACVWLPIDAKFPLEDYQRLVSAQDVGDSALVEEASKALVIRIKAEAKDIREKYLDPPYTTDFGILFVPIESLYAEILRNPGLFETIRREYKVIICGPTTIQAILNSLHMGFRTLAIQKRSSEVWTLLGAVKTDFGKFGDLLEKTHQKMKEASTTIENAVVKTRTIERKLNKVQNLHIVESESVELLVDVGEIE